MFAPKDQDNGRAAARGLTRHHQGTLTCGLRRAVVGTVLAAVTLPLFGAAAVQAVTTTPAFTQLKLVNGWSNYGNGTARAAVASINGIVQLKGGIKTSSTNPVPFTLPTGDRPVHRVYVPVDLCGGGNGRLDIMPAGTVIVETEGGANWANAQCYTSLDGVSFAPSAGSFTRLTLQNSWTSTGLASASPAVRVISGIVQLEGDMYTNGINPVPFTLPASFRPTHNVVLKVALCGRDSGDLIIGPGGEATVQAEGGVWSNAQCQTSLDGVWFAR